MFIVMNFLKEYSIEKGLGNLFNKTEKINKDFHKSSRRDSSKKELDIKKDFKQDLMFQKDNSDVFEEMNNE